MKELSTAQEADLIPSATELLPQASNEGEEPATGLDPYTAYSIEAMKMITRSLRLGSEGSHDDGPSSQLRRYDWETRERGAE